MKSPSDLHFYPLRFYSLSGSMHCSIESNKIPIQNGFGVVGQVARSLFDKLLSACIHPVCSVLCIHQELECVPYYCTTSYRELKPCPSSQNVPRLTYSQSCHHCSAADLWGYWSRGTQYERTLFLYFNIIRLYLASLLQPSVFSVVSSLSVWRNESNDTKLSDYLKDSSPK